MTEVFEHLRDYPLRSLEQVRRVLKPGGRLYFTTPNSASLINRLRTLGGKSTATPLADWMHGIPHARHAREYTFAEIDTLMEHAGLRILSRQSRHFHVDSGRAGLARPGKQLIDALSRVYPRIGPTIIVVAERSAM